MLVALDSGLFQLDHLTLSDQLSLFRSHYCMLSPKLRGWRTWAADSSLRTRMGERYFNMPAGPKVDIY